MVAIIRTHNYLPIFLVLDSDGAWEAVSDDVAREKASQVLRDAVANLEEEHGVARERRPQPLLRDDAASFDPFPYTHPVTTNSSPRRYRNAGRESMASHSFDEYVPPRQPPLTSSSDPLSYVTQSPSRSGSKRDLTSSSRSLDAYYSPPRHLLSPSRRYSHEEHVGGTVQEQQQQPKRRRATTTATYGAHAPPANTNAFADVHAPANLNDFDLFQGELLKSDSEGSGTLSV